MRLVYKSEVINNPDINLIEHMKNTIRNYYMAEKSNKYIIKMSEPLYSILDNEMYPHHYLRLFRKIEYVWDSSIKNGIYCIYKKNESIPIKLTPVKTLNEWFANLPLIYKLDLYNSYSGVITKHLK